MPPEDEAQTLVTYQRRLQKLKEKQALQGSSVAPEVLIEIEDIEQLLMTAQSEPEPRQKTGENFLKKTIDSEALAVALADEKELLLLDLEDGVKYEIELLKSLDAFALILLDDSNVTVETLHASPSPSYVKALYAYLKGHDYLSYKVDSYVTPYVVSRTQKVFLEFYSSETVQNVVNQHISQQLKQAKNQLAQSEHIDFDETMGQAIDHLLSGSSLNEFIKDSIMSSSFEEAMLQVLHELRADAIIGAAVGTAIITTFAILGLSLQGSLVYFLMPVIAVIITYKAVTFKKTLAEKSSYKLKEVVSRDFFARLNLKMAELMTDEIVNKIVKQIT